jgi:hypothetical protein
MDTDLRDLVRQRARNRCEYCHLRQEHSPYTLQLEHIVARQHGGNDELANLALACDRGNLHKGPNLSGIDPESNQVVSLFNPRTQSWHEHFTLIDLYIVGLTSCGRTTVRVLNMNAPRRVRLRAVLQDRGELEVE